MALKIETVLISSSPPYLPIPVPEISLFLLYPYLVSQQGALHPQCSHTKIQGTEKSMVCALETVVFSGHRKRLGSLRNVKSWSDEEHGERFGGERILDIYTV